MGEGDFPSHHMVTGYLRSSDLKLILRLSSDMLQNSLDG
jgi:hypothetical protein